MDGLRYESGRYTTMQEEILFIRGFLLQLCMRRFY